MDKGIIMELSKRKAVILTQEGEFKRIFLPKGHQSIAGQEVSFNFQKEKSPFEKFKTIPAFSVGVAFIIICFLFTNVFFFQSPNTAIAAYVSFDINPSIEFSVDGDLKIIQVVSINEDAEALVTDVEKYYGKNIHDFTNVFFNQLELKGYLQTDNEVLVVTTVMDKEHEETIHLNIQKTVNESKDQISTENVSVVIENTTVENHEDANKQGLSTGKYITYLEAKTNGSTISVSEAKKMPIEELKNDAGTSKKEKNGNIPKKTKQDRNEDPKGQESKGKSQDNKHQNKGQKEKSKEKHKDKSENRNNRSQNGNNEKRHNVDKDNEKKSNLWKNDGRKKSEIRNKSEDFTNGEVEQRLEFKFGKLHDHIDDHVPKDLPRIKNVITDG
jgi:hypothetical protein